MDDVYELADYLPSHLKDQNQTNYLRFLRNTFEVNYQSASYQFALLAYHMLMMSFVYFKIWQIRQTWPEYFRKEVALCSQRDKEALYAESPFEFSKVSESRILHLFKIFKCDDARIDKYVSLVKDRNEIAHANGHIYYGDQDTLDSKLNEVLSAVDEIQSHSKALTESRYKRFLIESSDEDGREYQDPTDQVREVLVRGSYLSQKEIEVCLSFDLTSLRQCVGLDIESAEILHQELQMMYSDA